MYYLAGSNITNILGPQLLFPLSHAVSTRFLTSKPSEKKGFDKSKVQQNEEELLLNSMINASYSLNCIIKNNYFKLDMNSMKKTTTNWTQSYSSLGNFDADKRFDGLLNSCAYVPSNIIKSKKSTPFDQVFYNMHNNLLITTSRTFKTKSRPVVSDDSSGYKSPFSRTRQSIFDFFRNSVPFKDKIANHNAENKSDLMKGIIEDKTLGKEEQNRIRIAFAEGVLSSKGRESTGGSKFIKKFREFMTSFAFLLVFVSGISYFLKNFVASQNNETVPEEINVTFDDIKGVEEAKQELLEVVEFLKNPEKFSKLGGKLPKGVLLVGPPGTGKTLMARAVAGEAEVPFFHAAGPEFDEFFVGQGARRIRDLFQKAKLRAPCVVFIDEIDSVGSKRTNSALNPHANQTINQLLTEMDGFTQNEGVVVLGATNRRDDLDKALLRPGRFDVEVQVPVPDLEGRADIIDMYLNKIKRGPGVDVDKLSRGTTGFTGADLENMINQAALRAAIDGLSDVPMSYVENSRDKVIMGPERKKRIPDEEANTITAYHEAGHAIVSHFTNDSIPLHKASIVRRGSALGHTAYIPDKERYHVTKAQLLANMDGLMGGRAAEELVFGTEKVTSGAHSDLQKATEIATEMVKYLGMSDKVGVRAFHQNMESNSELSQGTSEVIDNEIKRLLQESYERAKNIIRTHGNEHRSLSEALLKYESLDAGDIKAVIEGKPPKIQKMHH